MFSENQCTQEATHRQGKEVDANLAMLLVSNTYFNKRLRKKMIN